VGGQHDNKIGVTTIFRKLWGDGREKEKLPSEGVTRKKGFNFELRPPREEEKKV